MIQALIRFSVSHKLIVGLFLLAWISWGIYSLVRLPIDAVPDITNNQVQVITLNPALAPQEIEQFVTFPVELQLANIQGVEEIRSVSKYGISVITVVFVEEIPILDARQRVSEQLLLAAADIPAGSGQPEMMPITTGLGEIFQYRLAVTPAYAARYTATDLRTIQDWIIKRNLTGIPGIVEISSFGGFVQQYEIAIDPARLPAFDLTIDAVAGALERNNANAGGSYLEQEGSAFYIRAEGRAQSVSDLASIRVSQKGQAPVYVRDVAQVRIGHPPRNGAMTANGTGEAIGGITLMYKGANSNAVIARVKTRMEAVQQILPPGIEIVPFLDRASLTQRTIQTVRNNLLEGGLIVILVLVLLLGNLRAGFIVASVIPLALLFAFGMMHLFGVSANLMSLGAVDFGLLVDGAVIVVEAVVHHLRTEWKGQKLTQLEMDQAVRKASGPVRQAAAFGELIILVVYLPILLLEGVEGKMFVPMAQTVAFALLGALILSLTYVPMMAAWMLKKDISSQPQRAEKWLEGLSRLYIPGLKGFLRHPWLVLTGAACLMLMGIWGFSRLGGEFIPQLDEGDLAMQLNTGEGASLSQTIAMTTRAETMLLERFPQIDQIVSKIGSAEIPTDPMGVDDADVMIILHPRDTWPDGLTKAQLVQQMKAVLAPLAAEGVEVEFTQPIELRFNELLTGAKSDIAIKIYGEDLATLARLGTQAEALIGPIRGVSDVRADRTEGFPQLSIQYRRDQLTRYGIDIATANQAIQAAFAGQEVGVIYEAGRRFAVAVRLAPAARQTPADLAGLHLRAANGQLIPLPQLAHITLTEGPLRIARDNTRRQITVGVNVQGRDIETVVEEIAARLDTDLARPPGYLIEYGGAYAQLQQARQRLMVIVPVVLGLIFALLYFSFGTLPESLLILSAVPFSALGGIAGLWLRGMPFSISAGVGFIALFGVAVLNGVVLISQIRHFAAAGGRSIEAQIVAAARLRLRPVLITGLVASMGFLPMALSRGAGAEVQRPLATVVIGGLITATLLTLFVMPVLYQVIRRPRN